MNRAIIYRTRNRRLVVVAFACAIAIHVGAIALSASHAEMAPIICVMPPATVDLIIDQMETPPPPIDIAMPDPPPVPDVENDFQDEQRPIARNARIVPIARVPSTRVTSFSNVKTAALSAPRPDYPYEARRRRETGSGVAALTIDPTNGTVLNAEMEQSIGSAILDESTRSALRRWRFKPGTAPRVRVPITFTLAGASF